MRSEMPDIIFPAIRRTSRGLERKEFRTQTEINRFLRQNSGWMRDKEHLERKRRYK